MNMMVQQQYAWVIVAAPICGCENACAIPAIAFWSEEEANQYIASRTLLDPHSLAPACRAVRVPIGRFILSGEARP